MPDKKLVSLVIPIFNTEKYLNQLFNTLLNQTIGFEKMEIIFINDGSIDNSEELILEFTSKYENTIYLTNEINKGVAYTRNRGIRNCSTDYVIFMDSDDNYKDEFVEVYYNTITKYNSDIVKSNFRIKENEKIQEVDFKKHMQISNDFTDFPLGLLLIMVNGIYNVNFLKENNLYFNENLKRSEDSLFNVECFIKSKKENVFLLDYKSFTWNIHNTSLSHSFSLDLYNADWECYEKIIDLFIENNVPKEYGYKFTNFKITQQKIRFEKSRHNRKDKIKILEEKLHNAILGILPGYKKINTDIVKFV